MTPCAACERPTDGVICHRCTRRLGHILAELPAWLRELTTTVTRQAKTGAGDGGKSPKAFEQPLPYSPKAAALLHDITIGLAPWVDHVNGPASARRDPVQACAVLLGRVGDLRLNDRAGELLAWLGDQRQQIRRRVDNPAKRWVGRCTAHVQEVGTQFRVTIDRNRAEVVLVPTLTPRVCDADLRTRTGDRTIRCRDCGAEYDAVERAQWVIAQNAEHLDTAATIARILTGAGIPVKANTLRQWAKRGKLFAWREDDLGRPLYRVGDVRELVNAGREQASA